MKTYTFLIIALIAACAPSAHATLPTKAENFRLNDDLGNSHELFHAGDAPAVVLFTYSNDCPKAQDALPALKDLAADFAPKGVLFLALDPATSDTREAVAAKMKAAGLDIPVLMDDAQIVTKRFAATRYAEAIVIDPQAQWKIAFRGDAKNLHDVLTAQLAKQPLPEAAPSVGCSIDFSAAPAGFSYANDVAPILEAKCVSCHHKDGIAPFAMANLAKVQSLADMIREVVMTKRMPPWHADPHFGTFSNERSLTTKEQATLLAWIAAGAPPDAGAPDPLVKAEYNDNEWALGTPDTVLTLPEPESLPATGVVPYRYRYVPSGFTEDKWIRGVEVKAGTPKVVHHALIFVIYPKQYRQLQPNTRSGLGGYFASFLPGAIIKPYPDGSAQWIPAGSTFVFQMHYTPDGKPETDQTKMALYFAKEPPAEEFRIEAAHNNDFQIPPGDANYDTTAEYRFDRPAKIWGLAPHMHYRGSRFRFDMQLPDGPETTTLLNVPFYEFDWQPLYLLKDAVAVPQDTVIACDGGFDNSRFNLRNPDPTKQVRFGEQSFEEMFIGYVAYTIPRDDSPRVPLAAEKVARMGCGFPITAESLKGTKWRMGGQFAFDFKEDGRVVANDMLPGTWSVDGTRVYLLNPFHPVDLGIVGDELFFNTRPLRFMRGDASDDVPESWEQRDGPRRGRGEGFTPEQQKQREERRKMWDKFFPADGKPADATPAPATS